MHGHVPTERPTETLLWICKCDEKEPHGVIISHKGWATEKLTTKRSAQIYVDDMLKQKLMDDTEAEKVRLQIKESALKEPVPHDFHICTTCWIPVKHGHFTINDEEFGTSFSVRGAADTLKQIKKEAKLTAEDIYLIEEELLRPNQLPEFSDIDILLAASQELDRRRMAEVEGTVSMLAAVLELSLRRQDKMQNSPIIVPMAKGGTC